MPSPPTYDAGGSSPLVQRIYQKVFRNWRVRRLSLFKEIMNPCEGDRILDVGGYRNAWLNADLSGVKIDVINIDRKKGEQDVEMLPNGTEVRELWGDGCALEWPDDSYDIIFSNSVIEHVGDHGRQQSFAGEVMRVGKSCWVQTPAVACPIEPHFLGVGIHWLPRAIRPWVARIFSFRGLFGGHSLKQLQEISDTTRLITRKRLMRMFPGCRIVTERLFGIIPKSHIVIIDRDS